MTAALGRNQAFASIATYLCFCTFSIPVLAQSESGSAAVEGVLLDPSGGRIAGARVTLQSLDNGYTRVVTSDSSGSFFALAMPVGRYKWVASAAGFAIAQRDNLRLSVGTTARLDLRSELAATNQEVTVSSDGAIDAVDDGSTGATIPERFVSGLPIRGRNFTEFVQLTPAVMQESDRGGLVISGQRSINSNVAIDGVDFNDPVQGNQRGGNDAVFFFPQSAVREFQVVRSGAGVEVGRTNAGFVNVGDEIGR